MTWSLYRWTWQLEAPLHIGMPPAGSINRCRLYVPARALWGALTAELARSQSGNFPAYVQVGNDLREKTRLGYLFPAERVGSEWKAWLPCYEPGKGLVWRREGSGEERGDRALRNRLLSTRPGTAIEPESDTAEKNSLREFELVNPNWRDVTSECSAVALVGYVFVSAGRGLAANGKLQLLEGLEAPDVLWLGGDTRYGLGKIRRLSCTPASDFFGSPVEESGADPVVGSDRLLAHTVIPDGTGRCPLGQQEIVAGWDYGRLEPKRTVLWQPGSTVEKTRKWLVGEEGCWKPAVT